MPQQKLPLKKIAKHLAELKGVELVAVEQQGFSEAFEGIKSSYEFRYGVNKKTGAEYLGIETSERHIIVIYENSSGYVDIADKKAKTAFSDLGFFGPTSDHGMIFHGSVGIDDRNFPYIQSALEKLL